MYRKCWALPSDQTESKTWAEEYKETTPSTPSLSERWEVSTPHRERERDMNECVRRLYFCERLVWRY